jgi:preprotein translocase subunit YajC
MNGNPMVNLLPILLIFGVMYMFLIRPQMKQQKELGKMQSILKKNDQVVTVGGVYGTIVNVKEKSVVLKIDDNARMEVEKASVGRLVKEG